MPLLEQLKDPWLPFLGCAVVAYLAGAVNLSIAAARWADIEGLRRTGSGNPGVTNLYRAAGPKLAAGVLALEILKAVAVLVLPRFVGPAEVQPLVMLPYIFGNLFPVFHGFKGGKGVAAAVGAMLAVNPWVMLLGGGVFIALFIVFRRVSIGSLSMAVSYPMWGWWLGESRLFVGVSAAIAVVLAVTHRGNIARILSGTEPRLVGKKG